MVDKKQLLQLQQQARDGGRVCNFFYSEEGYIDSVFYRDMVYDPLSFAERERRCTLSGAEGWSKPTRH